MTPELLKAIAELIWPLIAAIIFFRLYPALRSMVQSRAFTLKIAGMEVSVQQASDQLQSQIDDLRKKLSELRGDLDRRAEMPVAVVQSRRILWVDDIPQNNAYAIAQLRARGYEVVEALSTNDAIAKLSRASPPFAAVISDMGRDERNVHNPTAGLELLGAMRKAGHEQPFLVCTTASAAQRYDSEVRAAGGSGATTSITEVFEFVRQATERA